MGIDYTSIFIILTWLDLLKSFCFYAYPYGKKTIELIIVTIRI